MALFKRRPSSSVGDACVADVFGGRVDHRCALWLGIEMRKSIVKYCNFAEFIC